MARSGTSSAAAFFSGAELLGQIGGGPRLLLGGTEQSRCSGAAAMGRNFWDPMDIERPNVNVIKFLLCQIGFISACWAGFLWSTGAAELPPPLGNADPATMATAIGGIALTGVITATIVQSTGGSEAPGQEDTSL